MVREKIEKAQYTLTIKPSFLDVFVGTHLSLYYFSFWKLMLFVVIAFLFQSAQLLSYFYRNLFIGIRVMSISILLSFPNAFITFFGFIEIILIISLFFTLFVKNKFYSVIQLTFFDTYFLSVRSSYEVKIPYNSLKEIKKLGPYLFIKCKDMKNSFIPLNQVVEKEKIMCFLNEKINANSDVQQTI